MQGVGRPALGHGERGGQQRLGGHLTSVDVDPLAGPRLPRPAVEIRVDLLQIEERQGSFESHVRHSLRSHARPPNRQWQPMHRGSRRTR